MDNQHGSGKAATEVFERRTTTGTDDRFAEVEHSNGEKIAAWLSLSIP